jgi:mannose-6-phosphate isomerase-like protein (cupin superfamily)
MKRRNFILSSLVASPMILSKSSLKLTNSKSKAFTVKAGEARYGVHTPFKGVNPNDLKISKNDTDGSLAMFEYIGNEKTGPSLHMHLKQDEVFYICEGEFLFVVGEEKSILKAGDTIFLPRNVPHTWKQLSDKSKIIYWVSPAGKMEDFFITMSKVSKPPTMEELQNFHKDHDMVILGPPLD